MTPPSVHYLPYDGVKWVVEGYYDPGEPMVMYYSDMSGHPGTPATFYIESICVEGSEADLYEFLHQRIISEIELKILENYGER